MEKTATLNLRVNPTVKERSDKVIVTDVLYSASDIENCL